MIFLILRTIFLIFHAFKHLHLLRILENIGEKSNIDGNLYEGHPLLRNRAHKGAQCVFWPLKVNGFVWICSVDVSACHLITIYAWNLLTYSMHINLHNCTKNANFGIILFLTLPGPSLFTDTKAQGGGQNDHPISEGVRA